MRLSTRRHADIIDDRLCGMRLADCSIIFLQDGYRSSLWQFISSNTHIGWHDVYVKLLLRKEKISLQIVPCLMSMTRSYIAAWYFCQMPEWQECSVAFAPIEQFWWVKHKWIGQIVFYVKGMKTNKMLRRLTKHLSNHQDNDRGWPWPKLLSVTTSLSQWNEGEEDEQGQVLLGRP